MLSALAAALCVAGAAQADTVTFNDIPVSGTHGLVPNDFYDGGLHFNDLAFAVMPVGLDAVPTGQASQFLEAGSGASGGQSLLITHYTGQAPGNFDPATPKGPDYVDPVAFNLWFLKIGLGGGNTGGVDTVTISGVSGADCTTLCNPTIQIDVTSHFQLLTLDGFTDLTSVTISQQVRGDSSIDAGWLGFDDFSYTAFVAGADNPRPDPPSAVPAANLPEPSAWALMIMGFGGVGALMRRNRRAALALA